MIEIRKCISTQDFARAIEITRAYMVWLDLDLSFQDIESELQNFETMYGSPDGLFLLCFINSKPAGGAGLRNLGKGICEMKRLFVSKEYTGQGAGKLLCAELIKQAKQLDYTCIRLDTVPKMQAAQNIYHQLGFRDIDAYRFNPDPKTRYMELKL